MSGSRFLRFFSILVAALLVTSNLSAQIKAPSGIPGMSGGDLPFGSSVPSRQPLMSGEASPVERPIDPATYRLGPNDQLLLTIPYMNKDVPVVVSLDNTVSLTEGLGLVDVSEMTLAGFRHLVDSIYRARSANYRNIGVSLLKPRSIYVMVQGDVLNPGRLVLSAADRVTTAIDAANRIPQDMPPVQQNVLMKKKTLQSLPDESGARAYSEVPRRVVLRHNDGSMQQVDLLRYLAFGDDRENPTLREGDVIVVTRPHPEAASVAIAGAVNAQTVIPYQRGDNALMLMRLAAGVQENADLSGAYLVKQTSTGTTTRPVDITDTAALAALALDPGDYLVVPRQVTRSSGRAGIVAVTGEVVTPSTYPIVAGETKLSEVMERAGGFTPDASLNGAYILRRPDVDLVGQLGKSSDPIGSMATSNLFLEDTTRYKYDIEMQRNRVSADFVGLFRNNDRSKDVVLESGDQIVVPRDPGAVYVRGRVAYSGWIQYRPGADAEYYIQAAGGFTEAADESRTQVQKYGTGVWEEAEVASIGPGDQIYVPGERDTPARTSAEVAQTYVGITTAIAGLVLNILFFLNR